MLVDRMRMSVFNKRDIENGESFSIDFGGQISQQVSGRPSIKSTMQVKIQEFEDHMPITIKIESFIGVGADPIFLFMSDYTTKAIVRRESGVILPKVEFPNYTYNDPFRFEIRNIYNDISGEMNIYSGDVKVASWSFVFVL